MQIKKLSSSAQKKRSASPSPRNDYSMNQTQVLQKRRDEDALSVFSKAIEAVRQTKGAALNRSIQHQRSKTITSTPSASVNVSSRRPSNKAVTFKNHEGIEHFYESQANQPFGKGHLDNMQQQNMQEVCGKKHFAKKRNQSDKKNMYPVLGRDKGGKDLFFRRQKTDYD